MPVSVAFIKELENVDPQLRRVLLNLLEEFERQREESVTKKEFNELKEIVRDLGKSIKELTEAQKHIEKRLLDFEKRNNENFARVWQSIQELTEAQKKSEERISALEIAVKELTEAQRNTEKRLEEFEKRSSEEFARVWQSIKELTEAQKRTEKRLEEFEKRTSEEFSRVWQSIQELTEAQKKSEERISALEIAVKELTEAQKRTEQEIAQLVRRMDAFEVRLERVEDRLEGISNSVGYSLENKTYKELPRLLKDRYGLKVEGRLIRRYFRIGRKDIQINIYGKAKKNTKEILILGECKVRPSRKEISRFEKYASKITEKEGFSESLLVLVAHDFLPSIEELLKERNIAYFWSYELE